MGWTVSRVALAGVAALALLASNAEAASLITNGSFEDTTGFVPDGNDTMTLGPGSTTMTGWTVTTNDVAWIGPSNPFGVTAEDGSYSLDLQGYSDGSPYGAVTQSISTVNGGSYVVSFYVGSLANSAAAITASAGGASQTFTTPVLTSYGWSVESLPFTATGPSTLISLAGTTASDGIYIGLDNVSVTCQAACTVAGAPEPDAWLLLLVGIGGVGAAMRGIRRKNGAALTAA